MSEPHNSHHHHDQGPTVHRITEAQESHTVEQHSRVLKYTISMSVRLACFIAAFFVHGWLQWVFLAGAIVLPYVAVVIANGGADVTKRQPPAEYFAGEDPRSLPSGATPGAGGEQAASEPGGESHESDEIVTDTAENPDYSENTTPDASGDRWATIPSSYPAEAPTTIDGSFLEESGEPGEPGQPAGGPRRHGGTR